MSSILIYFFIGITLGIDAFTVCLSLGTINISIIKIMILSCFIGIFHFIMPIIGYILGNYIKNIVIIKSNYIISIIFLFLIYEIINSKSNQDYPINISYLQLLLIAISVSIDSLTIGIGFGIDNTKIIIPSIIFSLITSSLSFIGYYLGSRLHNKYQTQAKYISIVIIVFLIIKYLINT